VTDLDIDGASETEREVLFLAWGAIPGRSAELAASVGASSICLYPPSASRRPRTSVRYVLSVFQTIGILWRRRPQVLVVTNPPLLLSLGALAWSRLHRGATVVLDSHPGAFGAMGDRMGAALVPVHRWLAPRVGFSLVAAPFWREIVEGWGGAAMVVHEAPGAAQPPAKPHTPLRVLYVGTFAQDEPVEALLGAAAAVPECEIVLTGDLAEAPPGISEMAPPNAHFVGFLDPHDYARQLEESDLVVSLTTEPNSVMRAAYEAVYANRPLIVSDWPILRELFPYAIHTNNDECSMAIALRLAIRSYSELTEQAEAGRTRQTVRWETQRSELVGRLRAARKGHRGPLADLEEPVDDSPFASEWLGPVVRPSSTETGVFPGYSL